MWSDPLPTQVPGVGVGAMPRHTAASNEDHVNKFVQGGGLKQQTLVKRMKVAEDISKFVYDSMAADVQDLIDNLCFLSDVS